VDKSSITDQNFGFHFETFINKNLLDKVNAVIQENSTIKDRFLQIEANKFVNKERMPENYGLTAIPTSFNTIGQILTSNNVGVMDKNAAERTLANFKAIADDSAAIQLPLPEEFQEEVAQNRLASKTYYSKIYNEALERYKTEYGVRDSDLAKKGLLLDEMT
jgi:hypothetical protein